MNLIIAGSRGITLTCDDVDNAIRATRLSPSCVICGCAKGPDTIGKQWAQSKGIDVKEFPADWERFGKSAGIRRNIDMANHADALIAFWDGESRGTKHMIDVIKKQHKIYFIFTIKDEKRISELFDRLLLFSEPMDSEIAKIVKDKLWEIV